MFKAVFTKDYLDLVHAIMKVTPLAREGLANNRKSVAKTNKVYSDYRALTQKEAELSNDKNRNGDGKKESIPVPPQLLTETQAGVISAYIISKLLSKPTIINVPQTVNQQEVATGVNNFMVKCQNKFKWRLKLNKTIHSIAKYGASGILIIPRKEGIDFETITPGNGYYDQAKQEGICILKKDYNFLMDLIEINSNSLTTMGEKIRDKPEMLHHILENSYDMHYHNIENHCDSDKGCGNSDGLTSADRLTRWLGALPKQLNSAQQKAYSGSQLINYNENGCKSCFGKDGTYEEVSASDKLDIMAKYFEITFHTVHLDAKLANIKALTGVKQNEDTSRDKYLIISVNGFPIAGRSITSDMIIMGDLFLSSDNEQACTLAESLESTETYNKDYHRSIILALKDIVDGEDIHYDPEVFARSETTGKVNIKSNRDLSGEKLNLNQHVFQKQDSSSAIAAISQTLPRPIDIADDITGNNPMLSAQHTKGNRTAIEGQNLVGNSESRFFVFAGNFYMSIVNALAETSIDLVTANPNWIKVYEVASDSMVAVKPTELIEYKERYYEEQTGLIPNNQANPDLILALANMFSTIPSLAEERDIGDLVTYFAKSGGMMDFPEMRRPHTRDDRLKTNNQLEGGPQQLALQLGQGNQPQQEAPPAELSPEEQAQLESETQQQV